MTLPTVSVDMVLYLSRVVVLPIARCESHIEECESRTNHRNVIVIPRPIRTSFKAKSFTANCASDEFIFFNNNIANVVMINFLKFCCVSFLGRSLPFLERYPWPAELEELDRPGGQLVPELCISRVVPINSHISLGRFLAMARAPYSQMKL